MAVVLKAFQSNRCRRFVRSWAFTSTSSCTSSASLGCRGKESEEDLQAFTAQVRKLRVRTFIFVCVVWVCFLRYGGLKSLLRSGVWWFGEDKKFWRVRAAPRDALQRRQTRLTRPQQERRHQCLDFRNRFYTSLFDLLQVVPRLHVFSRQSLLIPNILL